MILSGHKLYGYEYIGVPNLQTIGTLIFHYDYRRGATIEGGRVSAWRDLGPNSLTLTAESFRRFYDDTDGFGDDANAVTVQMRASFKPALNKLHLGNPFLFFAVVNFPAAPSALNRLAFTSQPANTAGQEFAIINTTGVFRCVVQNDSDTAIVNNSSAAIPTNEFILLMRYYYGSGTGSNNTKTVVKSTTSTFTSNPTFGTGNCSDLIIGKNSAGTGDNYRIKTIGAYDLTGKNSSQVDSFVATFISTLKSDPEYSSLVTP
jgi:hypothetical protein